ncbi:hypothetical protein [Streptomyces bacillaris]
MQRLLRALTARGLIAEGNQKAAAYIPSWCRPKVYDLLIPYFWYPDVEQVNAERRGRGPTDSGEPPRPGPGTAQKSSGRRGQAPQDQARPR